MKHREVGLDQTIRLDHPRATENIFCLSRYAHAAADSKRRHYAESMNSK